MLIAAGCWFLLSVVLFAISSEIQKSKLNGDAEDLLGGNPFLVASPQTILVMGTDVRPAGSRTRTATRSRRSASTPPRRAIRTRTRASARAPTR